MKDYWYIILPIIAVLATLVFVILKSRLSKEIDVDCVLGIKCTVTVEVNNFAGRGQVKIGKESWACRALYDEELYEVGEKVVVVAVEGVKLVCKRAI